MCAKNTEAEVNVSSAKYTFLDRQEVKKFFHWKSDSALYNAIKNDGFPKPLRAGGRRSLWRQSDVFDWIDSLEQKLSR